MAAIAGIVALAGGWDLYVDTVPDVFPSHEGVHPLSSFPFTITNDSKTDNPRTGANPENYLSSHFVLRGK